MRVRIATCKELPEIDGDAEPLAAAFVAAGIDAPLLAWDDPAVDWDEPAPTVLRSTWNYALHHEAFEAWLERVATAGPLWNPLPIVRDNLHKRYLLELAARGVPVVPTTLVESGGDLPDLARFVIKPEVGAGSLNARVFRAGDPEAREHLARLTRTGAALVQPYIESVEDHGERSMVWIDGALSHAIRKSPRFSGDSEQVTGPFPISDAERAVAEAALAPVAAQLLYARVDLARDASGQPMVMEMELVEPSLFFSRYPGSADRFVRGLLRRLGH